MKKSITLLATATLMSVMSVMPAYGQTHQRTAVKQGIKVHKVEPRPGTQSTSQSVTHKPAPLSDDDQTVVYSLHPTEEEFNNCRIINANNDDYKIEYYYALNMLGQIVDWPIYYNNNLKAELDADEWLITPAVELSETDCLYTVSIDARSGTTVGEPESFQICLGTSPEISDMTTVILDNPACLNGDFEIFTSTFGISQPGTYYIGIHITSPKGAWRVMMRDLQISYSTASADAPMEVENLTASPDPTGLNFATVEFDMPTMTINGKTIDASTEITATIATPVDTVTATGNAGQHMSVRVATESGINLITVKAATDNGESAESQTTVRCSIDTPVDPVLRKTVSPDNMSLTLDWDKVTQGIHDGLIVADDVVYNIYQYRISTDSQGNTTAMWYQIESSLKECSYTYTTTETVQDIYDFIVTAQTAGGESDGAYAAERLGKLIELPMTEDFSGGAVRYAGYIIDPLEPENYQATWGFGTAESLLEGTGQVGCMAAISQVMNSTRGRLDFPKFNAAGKHDMVVEMTAWSGPTTAPTTVYIFTPDDDLVEIGKIDPTTDNQWKTYQFTIPAAYDGRDWLSVVLDTWLPTYDYLLMVRDYEIRQLTSNDVAIASLTVNQAQLDGTTGFSFTISNKGFENAVVKCPSVWIESDGVRVADIDLEMVTTTLARNESLTLNGSFVINKVEYVNKPLTLNVALVDDDNDMTNNTASVEFILLNSNSPVIADLSGEENSMHDGIYLHWTHPDETQFTDGFEAYVHGEHGSKIGDWTNIDFDGKNVWGVEGVNFPDDVTPKAFQVINGTRLNDSNFTAHEGQQYLAVFSAQGAQSDDWFISPEIKGEDGFTFWTQILSTGFTEVVEVLASDSDSELDSFSIVETIEQSEWGWTFHNITLPASTRYVALHYRSNDQFGMFFDDFTYTPVAKTFEIKGFNLYRNGEKIVAGLTTPYYEDRDPDYLTNVYNVSVVASKDGGPDTEYALSQPFSLKETAIESPAADATTVVGGYGEIKFAGFSEGDNAKIFTPAGVLATELKLSEAETTVNISAGVYIVTIGGKSHKVMVK